MDSDKPMTRINPAQDQFDKTQAAYAASRARKAAGNAALNRIQPDASDKAKAVRQGKGGSTADEQIKPTPTKGPKLSGSWTPWGLQRS